MGRIYDVIIVGGGPAGYTAALYLARAGLSTLVIERMSVGGQMALTDKIENYPGFPEGIDGFTLGMNMQAAAERFGAVTEYGEVEQLRLSGEIKAVVVGGEDRLARHIIIATGASPRLLGIPGERELTSRGVHYCAHCDGRFYKDKRVAVIGGGNSAVGDAAYLARIAESVILVHRRDELRASKIEADRLFENKNVEYVWNSIPKEIREAEDGIILTTENRDGGDYRELRVDAVFISIGRVPASELVRDVLKLDEGGYILTDEAMRTSESGVYAIGDVRVKELRQVVTAVADGAIAASDIEERL